MYAPKIVTFSTCFSFFLQPSPVPEIPSSRNKRLRDFSARGRVRNNRRRVQFDQNRRLGVPGVNILGDGDEDESNEDSNEEDNEEDDVFESLHPG